MDIKKRDVLVFAFIAGLFDLKYSIAQTCPSSGTVDGSNNCYVYRDTPDSWADARQDCQNLGGDLVKISNQQEQDYLQSVMEAIPADSMWLGGTEQSEDHLEWVWASQCDKCGRGASECPHRNLDIALVIDQSGSIRDSDPDVDNWELIKEFLVTLTDVLTISQDNTQVAAVSFGNEGHVLWHLNANHPNGLSSSISNMGYLAENTNTSGGIKVMTKEIFTLANGDRLDAENIAIIITDGKSSYDVDETIPSAQAAKDAGIKIYSIGVTANANEEELMGMSSSPQQKNVTYWTIPSFSSLNTYSTVDDIMTYVCQGAETPKAAMYGKNRKLKGQGCFSDWTVRPALSIKLDVDQNTPENCMDACRSNSPSNLYSGVQINDCYCDSEDNYYIYGSSKKCVLLCDADQTQWCGFYVNNFVYNIYGEYSAWARTQPNSALSQTFCGLMKSDMYSREVEEPQYSYAFASTNCTEHFRFMCDIPFGSCGLADSEGSYTYLPSLATCYYISWTSKSWYAARSHCLERGGDLSVVANLEDHDIYRLILPPYIVDGSIAVWISLTNRQFYWDIDDYLIYFNFAPSQPSASMLSKLAINGTTYEWFEANEDDSKTYFCKIALPETTTSTTAAPTTTTSSTTKTTTYLSTKALPVTTTSKTAAPTTTTSSTTKTTTYLSTKETPTSTSTEVPTSTSTKSPTTTKAASTSSSETIPAMSTSVTTASDVSTQSEEVTSGGTNPDQPDIGASTDGSSGLSTIETALAVLICVVVIAIIIALVAFFINKAKKKGGRVEPSKAYDASSESGDAGAGYTTGQYQDTDYLYSDKAPQNAGPNGQYEYTPM